MTVKFIFNNQKDFWKEISEQIMTRAKPHFHHEIKFSISNFQLLNCQRGNLAGELMRHSKEFLLENYDHVVF